MVTTNYIGADVSPVSARADPPDWKSYLDMRLSALEDRLDEQREILTKHMDRKDEAMDRLDKRIRTLEFESANMRGRVWMLGALLSMLFLVIDIASQFAR